MKVTLVCKKSDRKILYMEASKDCVDVLMSFLLLPIGSSLKLVHGEANAGMAKVFRSVQQMDDSVMQGEKKVLVDPKIPEGFMENILGLECSSSAAGVFKPNEHTFYRCSSGRSCNTTIYMDDNTQRCSSCGFTINSPVQVIAPTVSTVKSPAPTKLGPRGGFVKENISFMVTDDLQIFPVSAAKSVALMNLYKVEAVSDLETLELDIGPTEILQLLKISFTSTTVLNDVFQVRLPKFASIATVIPSPSPTPAPQQPPPQSQTQPRYRYA